MVDTADSKSAEGNLIPVQVGYTKVYFTSNIPLEKQYIKYQTEETATWQAFKRRIHKVIDFDKTVEPKQMELMPIDDDELPF